MRTKNEIKVDRLFSLIIGNLGVFSMGYYLSTNNLLKMFLSFIAVLFLIRVDRCNNDLEYGRYTHKSKQNTKGSN